MSDEEVIKWVRKTYGKDYGKTLQKYLDDDARFAQFIRDNFPIANDEDPRG